MKNPPFTTTKPRAACRLRTLAAGHICVVQQCEDCGCVSIHMGPTTVRLDEGALASLTETLTAAVRATREAADDIASLRSVQQPS